MNKRILKMVIVLAAVILSIPVVTQILEMVQEMVQKRVGDFIIYENSSRGIRIKYPENWMVIEESENNIVRFLPPWEIYVDSFPENLAIGVVELPSPMKMDKLAGYVVAAVREVHTNADIFKSDEVIIGQMPAHRIIYTDILEQEKMPCHIKVMLVYVIKDKKVYMVSYLAETDEYADFLEVIQEMIDSFEFL